MACRAAVLAVTGLLAACGSGSGGPGADGHGGAGGAGGLPTSHVHGVDVNPADGRVYVATHDGLFRLGGPAPERVGPVVDLMGFAVAGPDHFYASGHPGEGSDLPNPVGLIESRDAGRTWRALSRQGQSDFHALAVSSAGVVGFDGGLRISADGRSWQDGVVPASPFSMAAAPDGGALVATTESGPIRSTDGGRTWTVVAGAPLLGLVAWAAGRTVTGVAADRSVYVSNDAGLTWQRRGTAQGRPHAVGAASDVGGVGGLRVLVATDKAVLQSTDGGATFAPLAAGPA